MKKHLKFLILLVSLPLCSCAPVAETTKTLWGSSTRALENARTEAISKIYSCTIDECFDGALSLGRNYENLKPINDKFYDVFLQDRIKSHMVVMGIKGNVNTTEVGIFFSQISETKTKIEITSLSSNAKQKVADALFEELDFKFKSE